MYLSKDQIAGITRGALEIGERDGEIHFYRFNERQRKYYESTSSGFFTKCFATSGINFDFYTDSNSFGFSYSIANASSRNFYYFDIYVDGVLTNHLGESPMWIKQGRIEIKLPDGEHRVRVWFPNLACASVSEVALDDGASLRAAEYKHSMICWGDSITQGYDAIFPSLAYTNRLAEHFGANMINQAIGGEKFVPGILGDDIEVKPDIITIAYGTNDWSALTRDAFFAGVDGFLEGIAKQYSDVRVFVITPLWRGDKDKITKFGSYFEAVKYIADKAKSCGLEVIDGYCLTPHYYEFYSDQRLHPNDLGYGEYTKNLIAEIEKRGF